MPSLDIALVVIGLPALLLGGDLLVRGAVSLASLLRVSPLVISLTLVGFGTSTPELVASLSAALKGAPGLALGNVVGSNIANILLILGAAALVSTVTTRNVVSRSDSVWFVATAVIGAALASLGMVPRWMGAALLGLLALYMWNALRSGTAPGVPLEPVKGSLTGSAAICALGLTFTLGGAMALVDGATGLARAYGISETVIGLTLVAVGTSLPELATSLVAAWRGRGDVALGNILGSGVFNILAILGATALVSPLAIPQGLMSVDAAVMVAATAGLTVFLWRGRPLSRSIGCASLIAYAAYVAWLSQT